jgi:DNA repair protein RadC
MTVQPVGREALAGVLRKMLEPSGEGALALVFLDGRGRAVHIATVAEGARSVDELFLRHLVTEVRRVGLPGVLVAITRADARPARRDLTVRRELARRLAGSAIRSVELMTIGPDGHRLGRPLRVAAAA